MCPIVRWMVAGRSGTIGASVRRRAVMVRECDVGIATVQRRGMGASCVAEWTPRRTGAL